VGRRTTTGDGDRRLPPRRAHWPRCVTSMRSPGPVSTSPASEAQGALHDHGSATCPVPVRQYRCDHRPGSDRRRNARGSGGARSPTEPRSRAVVRVLEHVPSATPPLRCVVRCRAGDVFTVPFLLPSRRVRARPKARR
jgi:hypothetical protein